MAQHSLRCLIAELVAAYAEAGLDCGDNLLPPATKEALEGLATAVGRPLPGDLVALYRIHGGQAEIGAGVTGLFGWERLLTPAQAAGNYWIYRDTAPADQGTFPPGPGEWSWHHPRLIPFASFNADDLCIDAETGRVWHFVPSGGVSPVSGGDNLTDLLRKLLEQVRRTGEAPMAWV